MTTHHRTGSNSVFVAWGNGPGDEKGYSKSLIAGYLTTQQFAAMIGKNQGTARDVMSGRRGDPLGEEISGAWHISEEHAIAYLVNRDGLDLHKIEEIARNL